jgi:hypothetical protein
MADALINHAFVSAFSDGADTNALQPSDWNAALLMTAGSNGQVLTRDTTSATGANWSTPSAAVTTCNLTTSATGTLQAAQEPAHLGDVTNIAGSLTTAIKASVGLTGVPTAPTAAIGTATTQIATTAHVATAITVKRASAFNSAVQSINTATWTVLTLDSEDWDTDTFHSTSSLTSRMTIPSGGDGFYAIHAKTRFAAHATGVFRGISIYKNGAAVRYLAQAVNNPTDCDVEIYVQLPLVATDYIECAAYQDSGGALNIGQAARTQSTELQVARMGL